MSKADDLLSTIVESLRNHQAVRAVWLAGSRGRGTHDEFSDIDFWIAMHDETIVPFIDDPLAFVHSIVPTVMHILEPSIAPAGGSFVSSWIPVEEEFVQVDWYLTPTSSAKREAETMMIYGEVPVREPLTPPNLSRDDANTTAGDNITLALRKISDMAKHARRDNFWGVANSARNADKCINAARSFMNSGVEPGFATAQESLLAEPPPSSILEVQALALILLDELAQLSNETGTDLKAAIKAMRNVAVNMA